jgi:hypothetical protein
MGVGDFFSKINGKMEAGYSKVLDFLENKGLPVYRYNDFLETHGIPAMWATILILIIIILIIVLLTSFLFHSQITFAITLIDTSTNEPLPDAQLMLTQSGNTIFNEFVNNSQKITVSDLSVGDEIGINASIDNYVLKYPEDGIVINDVEVDLVLAFEKEQQIGDLIIRLLDSETDSIVGNAPVSIQAGGEYFTAVSDGEGVVKFEGVPLNEEVSLRIEADGYAVYDFDSLLQDGLNDIQLEPLTVDSSKKGAFRFEVLVVNNEPIGDANIIIYEVPTDKEIGNLITSIDGIAQMDAPYGTTIRYVVMKDGFKAFDSNEQNITRTLRQDVVDVKVKLSLGGSELFVSVFANGGDITVESATIALLSESGTLIEQKQTDFSGTVSFSGLDVKRTYYVSAYAEDYYPKTIDVDPLENTNIRVDLETVDMANSADLRIIVTDFDNNPVPNAQLKFKNLSTGKYFFVPNALTKMSGFYSILLPVDLNVEVIAKTTDMEGSSVANLQKGENKMEIFMEAAGGQVTLKVFDWLNNAMDKASITVKLVDGIVLDEGATNEKGEFNFFTLGENNVIVDVVDKEGNVFSKMVEVQDIIEIRFDKSDALDVPSINLVRILDSTKEEVTGLKSGSTYFFEFKVSWPQELVKGGLHLRLGEDNVDYDIQDVGILAVDAIQKTTYGLYYSSSPFPGNINKDFTVNGRPGMMNKWVEIYYDNPKGVNIIRAKVKVLETDLDIFDLQYRVWGVSGDGKYVRNPEDSVLKDSKNVDKKYHLYAGTHLRTIRIMKTEMDCLESFCVSYSFKDDLVEYDEFYPVIGDVYALDLDFVPNEDIKLDISMVAEGLAKTIYLNNNELDPNSFAPKDFREYNLALNKLELKKGAKKRVRIYFTAEKAGAALLNLKVVGQKELNKKFAFEVSNKKNFSVRLKGLGIVEVGEEIYINVLGDSGEMTNAYVSLLDHQRRVIGFLRGNNTVNMGKNGDYKFNGLESGIYSIVVKVPGYATREIEFVVSKLGVLEAPTEIEIKIPANLQSTRYEVDIKNKSKFAIKGLVAEIIRNNAESFEISSNFLKSYLLPRSNTTLSINASTDTEEVMYGDFELMISGTLEGGEIVRSIIHVSVVSNSDVDSECLAIEPNELSLSMPNVVGFGLENSVKLKNNCNYDLVISPNLINRYQSEFDNVQTPEMTLQMMRFELKKGEEISKAFKLTNNKEFNSDGKMDEYYINFETPFFQKQVPVIVNIWNSGAALSINTNPSLYLTGGVPTIVPISITNHGNLPVKNIVFSVSEAQGMQYGYGASDPMNQLDPYSNRTTSLVDTRMYEYLAQNRGNPYTPNTGLSTQLTRNNGSSSYPGTSYDYQNSRQFDNRLGSNFMHVSPNRLEVLMPGETKVLRMTALPPGSTTSVKQGYVNIIASGKMEFQNRDIRSTFQIFATVSSPKCFKLASNEGVTFRSAKPSYISRKVVFINECAEPVMVTGLSVSEVGGNEITLKSESGGSIVSPRERKSFTLAVDGYREINFTSAVEVLARSIQSGVVYNLPVNVNVMMGRSAAAADMDEGEPSKQFSTFSCNSELGEKVEAYFPKIGEDTCGSKYCDGESAAKYILSKIENYVSSYKETIGKTRDPFSKSQCDIGSKSCGFIDLGVDTPRFIVYLAEDEVPIRYVEANLKKYSKLNLLTATSPGGSFDLQSRTGTFTKNLWVDRMSGCGRYEIELEGATQVLGQSLQTDSYNVYAKVTKSETDECTANIENASLYLPRDKSVKEENTFGFRPGYINYVTEDLKNLANSLSKKLYSNERIKSGVPNTLNLKKGENQDNSLVCMEIKEQGGSVLVEATIDSSIPITSERSINSVIDAIDGFLEGNFKGCLSPSKKTACVNSKGDTKVGEFQISGCAISEIQIFKGKVSCSAHISASSQNRVNLKLNVPVNITGLTEFYVLDSEGAKIGNNAMTFQPSRREGQFALDVNLVFVVEDVSAVIRATTGQVIDMVSFIIESPEGSTLKEQELKFKACGISPEKFVEETLTNRKDGLVQYAPIIWDGVGDQKNMCDIIKVFSDNLVDQDFVLVSADNQCKGLYEAQVASAGIAQNLRQSANVALATAAGAGLASEILGALILSPLSLLGAGINAAILGFTYEDTLYTANRLECASNKDNCGTVTDVQEFLHEDVGDTWVGGLFFKEYGEMDDPKVTSNILKDYGIVEGKEGQLDSMNKYSTEEYVITGAASVGAVTANVVKSMGRAPAASTVVSNTGVQTAVATAGTAAVATAALSTTTRQTIERVLGEVGHSLQLLNTPVSGEITQPLSQYGRTALSKLNTLSRTLSGAGITPSSELRNMQSVLRSVVEGAQIPQGFSDMATRFTTSVDDAVVAATARAGAGGSVGGAAAVSTTSTTTATAQRGFFGRTADRTRAALTSRGGRFARGLVKGVGTSAAILYTYHSMLEGQFNKEKDAGYKSIKLRIIPTDPVFVRNNVYSSRYDKISDNVFDLIIDVDVQNGTESKSLATKCTVDAEYDTSGGLGSIVLGSKVVDIAERELSEWKNGEMKEWSPDASGNLFDYSRAVGKNYIKGASGKILHWSANFISYVMVESGFEEFPVSNGHIYYFKNIKENSPGSCKAYPISEISKIKLGDILCRNRIDVGNDGQAIKFDSLPSEMVPSHCDIVAEKSSTGLRLIGGNLSDSITKRTVSLSSIKEPNYFGFISCSSKEPTSELKDAIKFLPTSGLKTRCSQGAVLIENAYSELNPKVDKLFILATMWQESDCDHTRISRDSRNMQGLMQLTGAAIDSCKKVGFTDLDTCRKDPTNNVLAGTYHLNWGYNQLNSVTNAKEKIILTAFAYNRGRGTANLAIKLMKEENKNIVDAMHGACLQIFKANPGLCFKVPYGIQVYAKYLVLKGDQPNEKVAEQVLIEELDVN